MPTYTNLLYRIHIRLTYRTKMKQEDLEFYFSVTGRFYYSLFKKCVPLMCFTVFFTGSENLMVWYFVWDHSDGEAAVTRSNQGLSKKPSLTVHNSDT